MACGRAVWPVSEHAASPVIAAEVDGAVDDIADGATDDARTILGPEAVVPRPGHGRVEGVRLLAAFPGTEHEFAGLLSPNLLVAQQAVLDADRVGRQRDRQRTGVAGCGMSTKKEKRSPATGITEQRLPSATYVVPWVAGPIASLIGIRPLKFVDPA